jgi:hypothetical protein
MGLVVESIPHRLPGQAYSTTLSVLRAEEPSPDAFFLPHPGLAADADRHYTLEI